MRQSAGLKDKKKTKQKRERGGREGKSDQRARPLPAWWSAQEAEGRASGRQTQKHFFPAPFSFSLFSPAPKNRLQRREGREKKQGGRTEKRRSSSMGPRESLRRRRRRTQWAGEKHDGGRRRFHGRRVSFVRRAKPWKEFVGAGGGGGGGGGVEADRGGGGGAQRRVQSQAAAAEKQMWWLSD